MVRAAKSIRGWLAKEALKSLPRLREKFTPHEVVRIAAHLSRSARFHFGALPRTPIVRAEWRRGSPGRDQIAPDYPPRHSARRPVLNMWAETRMWAP